MFVPLSMLLNKQCFCLYRQQTYVGTTDICANIDNPNATVTLEAKICSQVRLFYGNQCNDLCLNFANYFILVVSATDEYFLSAVL